MYKKGKRKGQILRRRRRWRRRRRRSSYGDSINCKVKTKNEGKLII